VRLLKIILFLLAFCNYLLAVAEPMEEIQKSYIDSNLPNTFEEFNQILERDLIKYFSGSLKQKVTVQYELLRKQPTQSGVAYPKFYAWVKISSSKKEIVSGAVRVAVIDKTRVKVINFVSKKQITNNPKYIETIFPSSLCDNVRIKAGIK
jgi:hypothetical protein